MDEDLDLVLEEAPQASPGHAAQACTACRKQKRKCDKVLPACSLCNRIGRSCEYTLDSQAPAPTPEEFAALRQQVSNLEQIIKSSGGSTTSNGSSRRLSGNGSAQGAPDSRDYSPAVPSILSNQYQSWLPSPSFPSLYFLDSNAFVSEHFQIQPPNFKMLPGVLTALGNSVDLRHMVEHFFASVQTYFPIISKIRLYQHLADPTHEPGVEMAFLFLTMKLICTEIPEGVPPQTQLYQDVKSFYHYIETQNGFSIRTIQGLLLIAMYETGNAIYPAAYLTIGNCARVGYAMGLHERDAPQMLPRTTTWTEQEERRRVWWAVVILDRFVNIGHRGKPFATNDPSVESYLPTDDAAWDRGQMLAANRLALSASQKIKAAPFARMCQASHLLGKILRHLDEQGLPLEFRFDEALKLNRATRALVDVLLGELEDANGDVKPDVCVSLSVCYSGLLVMYDNYSCTERAPENAPETHLVMQQDSIEGLSVISNQIVVLARRLRGHIEQGGMQLLSPMVVDCFYQAAANCTQPRPSLIFLFFSSPRWCCY
jgi:hypothetical protein